MTTRERFILRVRRKLTTAQPSVVRAYMRSLRSLLGRVSDAELDRLLKLGSTESVLAALFESSALQKSFGPLRNELGALVTDGMAYFMRDIPGKAVKTLTDTAFGVLNPRVVDTIRSIDDRVMLRLGTDLQASVRAIIEQGYRDGLNPRATARNMRSLIGLSPAELKQVDNFRDGLLGQNGRSWRTYERRDRRFDASIERASASGKGLTSAQVDKMVEAYERRRTALSAEANARTMTLDSYKEAQNASWQTAIDSGIIDADGLQKEWLTVGDGRVRDEHEEMNGEVVPFDSPYSNGQMIPGETDWNCRCWSRMFVGKQPSY
jgi:hypothetical protein